MSKPSLLAVITGGGTGIGRKQALALSKIPGMAVIITGRRKEQLEKTQLEIGADKCHILSDCDTGKAETWKRIASLVKDLGGALHFLGNTAGSLSPPNGWPASYEDVPAEAIQAYNDSYITGVQLSYHFLAPLLIQGAEATGNPSIVINISSIQSLTPKGEAHNFAFYHPAKAAEDAITRCAYGLYKDKNVLTYGLNPLGYGTEVLVDISASMGVSINEFCAPFNPFPLAGEGSDIGQISAALIRGDTALEAGVAYVVMPLPPELWTSTDATTGATSSSIFFSASIHGPDLDELSYNALKKSWSKIPKAYDGNGKVIPDNDMALIRKALTAIKLND